MEAFILLIILVAGLAAGGFIGYYFRKLSAIRQIDSAERKAEDVLIHAKEKQSEILLEAKEKAIKLIDEAKQEAEERRQEIKALQTRVEKRETVFDQKLLEFENKQQDLTNKLDKIENLKKEILEIKEQHIKKLEEISRMNLDEAKQALFDKTEDKIKEELAQRVQKLELQSTEEVELHAKQILTSVIERCSSSHAVETTTTVVTLPNDEMKGRIIGREGRNIKALEQITGVEIVVDDTPEAIVISGFSTIRRQLAKLALDKLISDGRIHPGRIEEAVEEAKKELALDIRKAGEAALREAGLAGFDPKLVQILGRLKYRTSYGQNQLQHALETSHLAGLLAQELGADVPTCRKGGLFHDIGKAVDHEIQGTHPEIGYDILKKFGLSEEVAYIARGHHEDPPKTLECLVVKIADAVSGSRMGARKDTYENYVQRLTELEATATGFEGVEKAYAIQAGRELRVFVMSDKMDDWQATKLARDVADKIESDLKYPGEIKVAVIREKRIIEYAR